MNVCLLKYIFSLFYVSLNVLYLSAKAQTFSRATRLFGVVVFGAIISLQIICRSSLLWASVSTLCLVCPIRPCFYLYCYATVWTTKWWWWWWWHQLIRDACFIMSSFTRTARTVLDLKPTTAWLLFSCQCAVDRRWVFSTLSCESYDTRHFPSVLTSWLCMHRSSQLNSVSK